MKTRADQRVPLWHVSGNGVALIAALAAAACQSERPTAPQTPTTTTTTFQGVLAGPLGESGVITLTTGTEAAAAASARLAGAVTTSSAVTENLSGRLLIIGSASIDLTGTLNTATGAIAVSGGGYSFAGTLSSGKVSGTYTGPNGAGTFTGLSSTASTPTFV